MAENINFHPKTIQCKSAAAIVELNTNNSAIINLDASRQIIKSIPMHRDKSSNHQIIKLILLFFLFSGCYSFKSGRIPDNIKTINIKFFPNRAAVVNPSLSQIFTDNLKQKFQAESNLTIVTGQADLTFEGYISEYTNTPTAIQNSQQAALNRLTISVNVKFVNEKDPKADFETTFSRFAEYNSSLNFTTVEPTLIGQINKLLVDDIYNRAVTNW